jgi:hypothetical protein
VNHERGDLLIGRGCEDPGEIGGLTRLEGAQFYARRLAVASVSESTSWVDAFPDSTG